MAYCREATLLRSPLPAHGVRGAEGDCKGQLRDLRALA
jgi:hypothetical protein